MKKHIVFIIVIVAGLLTSCKYFKQHRLFSKDVDTLLDISNQIKPVSIDTSYSQIDIRENIPIKKPAINNTGYKYFVIIGSFRNQDYANKYAKRYREMGYNTDVMFADNGFHRVSAGSYMSYQDGINGLKTIRAAEPVRAWLYVKN